MAALLALTVTVALAGCSPSQTTSASGHAELARLVALEHDFPPDFSVQAGEVQQAHAQVVDQVGTTVSYGKSFSVDPPQCRALLKPVDGTLGANFIGLRGDGPDEQTIYVGADDQVTVPARIPAKGCDRMTFDVDSALPNGTANRIAAPRIAGVTTVAFKVHYTPPEYYYIAILDDHVYVHVDARVSPDFQAQPFLPDLLVKAVAAIRGR
ncbi:DUF5642 family protein [Mycobacterium sp. RTGN4]|nr:DUF5642 family protein [Mycobacterium sp. RTGN4]